jgi:cyclopropane fatty-acyl-phospholipid synthase-like methyltransferase
VSGVAPNRIDRPGTAEEAWDEWAGLKHLPLADPLDWPSVMIVAAHLDVEVLGAGGVMAMLAAAARRTEDLTHVRVEQRDIPGRWPDGRFDLIVFSEILYYLGNQDLEQALKHAVSTLEPEGTLLAVHWRHPVADYPRSGDDVHQVLAGRPGLARLVRHDEPDFLAEVYIRTEGTPASVAQAMGLV